MKQLLLKSISAFLVILTIASCQKDESVIPTNQLNLREDHTCCVASLPSASELVYTGTHGVTVSAYNDDSNTYVTISRASGVMTIRYRNPGVCPTPTNGPTVCEGCPSWSTTFPNPEGWECGDVVSFSFYLNGLGGPPPNTLQTCVINYTLKDVCETCDIQAGDYFTYSQGFYLNSKNGEAFLNAHPELGPVTVGCGEGGTSTTYTLAEIIDMESGNSSAPGILAKQIITMTLNVSASSFLASGEDLGCLVVVADEDPLTTLDDMFAGMTVDEIIEAANAYVGGCDTTSFSEGDLTAILSAIVDNFHEGEDNLGLLTCCGN